jgi:hypothetical protein
MLSNQSGLEQDRVIAVLLHDINTQERRNFRIVSLMGSGEQHLTYLVEDPAAGCHAVLKWIPQ